MKAGLPLDTRLTTESGYIPKPDTQPVDEWEPVLVVTGVSYIATGPARARMTC